MEVEYEATFENINKDEVRQKLKDAGATLVRPEFDRHNVNFDFPPGIGIPGGWLRVRDEAGEITMSLKVVNGEGIERQKETKLNIDSFDNAVQMLGLMGCLPRASQESKRELWKINETEITIDEWPFLEPFVEIESKSEQSVKEVSELLGFDYNNALFDSVDAQYSKKYNISLDAVNLRTPKILFDMENPFINRND
jgi:adenylate cyclase, class 2